MYTTFSKPYELHTTLHIHAQCTQRFNNWLEDITVVDALTIMARPACPAGINVYRLDQK